MQQDQVECQTNPELWFSEVDEDIILAKDLCNDCWFKDNCTAKAIFNSEVHGVWGGINFSDPEERKTSDVVLCRAKKHLKKRGIDCSECRKISRRRYEQKTKRSSKIPTKPRLRKHHVGGYCVNGHKLEDKNIVERENDGAILCRKCITGRTYGKYRKGNE